MANQPLDEAAKKGVEVINDAVGRDDIPKLYANGFTVGLSNADVVIVLQRFGKPVALLNISYTLAKTLAQRVGTVVSDFEASIYQNILTTDRIDEAVKEASEKKAAETKAPAVSDKVDVH